MRARYGVGASNPGAPPVSGSCVRNRALPVELAALGENLSVGALHSEIDTKLAFSGVVELFRLLVFTKVTKFYIILAVEPFSDTEWGN